MVSDIARKNYSITHISLLKKTTTKRKLKKKTKLLSFLVLRPPVQTDLRTQMQNTKVGVWFNQHKNSRPTERIALRGGIRRTKNDPANGWAWDGSGLDRGPGNGSSQERGMRRPRGEAEPHEEVRQRIVWNRNNGLLRAKLSTMVETTTIRRRWSTGRVLNRV